jgi:hypothetical protein
MYVWSADSISCFASSKLLPRTVIESSAQTPFHPSASGQKMQSTGTDAMTGTLTALTPLLLLMPSWRPQVGCVDESGDLQQRRRGALANEPLLLTALRWPDRYN